MPLLTRNSVALTSFVAYCEAHPTERFWQALRNWSKWNFIYGSREPLDDYGVAGSFTDTFYLEGLDGTREIG